MNSTPRRLAEFEHSFTFDIVQCCLGWHEPVDDAELHTRRTPFDGVDGAVLTCQQMIKKGSFRTAENL